MFSKLWHVIGGPILIAVGAITSPGVANMFPPAVAGVLIAVGALFTSVGIIHRTPQGP